MTPDKVTLRELAERMLASLPEGSGMTVETVETFLRSYFNLISDGLQRGETVKIKGLGQFAPGVSLENPVIYVPGASLAATVNEPFAFFEPVPIDADSEQRIEESVPEPEPAPAEHTDVPEAPEAPEVPETPEIPVIPETPTPPAYSAAQPPVWKPEPEPEPEPELEPEPAPQPAAPDPAPCPYRPYVTEKSGIHWSWILVGAIVGLIVGFFAGSIWTTISHIDKRLEVLQPLNNPEPLDNPEPPEPLAPAVPPAPALTDTVRAGYYFTNMAEKYYGDRIFWVYIYEKNADKLKHPEHTLPGTVLVIPPAEEYNIDKNNPESRAEAKRLAADIYQRYKK